ncbi:hypothetical protein F5J12DRAFT_781896 [Pisolithus orientalis]|uniref:uncharacterized protein n=1 Tax=Pisolithus orientalis TaxID=936130 RepID=UPI00222467AD|nr:uncharacterized protein F5J12DRAFT_781896 [Pisolithus orientalis]KAI6010934.1 hypothetical protein F5J12DRAFT_781896 [Pisolithus orientalis]
MSKDGEGETRSIDSSVLERPNAWSLRKRKHLIPTFQRSEETYGSGQIRMGVKARLASVPVPISKSDWSNPSTYHRVKHHLETPDQYHKRVQCRASLSQTLLQVATSRDESPLSKWEERLCRTWTPSGHEVSLRLQRGRSLQRCQPAKRGSNFGEPSSPLDPDYGPSSDILLNGQVSKATCIIFFRRNKSSPSEKREKRRSNSGPVAKGSSRPCAEALPRTCIWRQVLQSFLGNRDFTHYTICESGDASSLEFAIFEETGTRAV